MPEENGKVFEHSYQQAPAVENVNGSPVEQGSGSCLANICWFQAPTRKWSLSWYLTPRGAENLHIYIWILKDLAWAQNWYTPGLVFGSAAIVWSMLLLHHAIKMRNINEFWAFSGQLFWLSSNMWWMSGDMHDLTFPDAPEYYPSRTREAGHMMEASLCWMAIYYLIIQPFKLFQPSAANEAEFNDLKLKPRFPQFFKSWRDYERVHILFWLGKDCAWNTLDKYMWIIFVIPTFLIALDFVLVTLMHRELVVDHAHYVALFLWVVGNMVWAAGEIWDPDNDTPFQLLRPLSQGMETARWYSSWILVSAYLPIVLMYYLWMWAYLNRPDTLLDDEFDYTPEYEDPLPPKRYSELPLGDLEVVSTHKAAVQPPVNLMGVKTVSRTKNGYHSIDREGEGEGECDRV